MLTNESLIELLKKVLTDTALVQSFSGVRTRFGKGPEITAEHSILASAYGYAYAKRQLGELSKCTLLVGRDPRPTGEAVASALVRGFLAAANGATRRVEVIDLGIITTPLLETAVRALEASGGVMVTASHNPVTDNGFKFLTGVQAAASTDRNEAPPGALLSAPAMGSVVDHVQRIANGDAAQFLTCLQKVDAKTLRKSFGKGEDHLHRIKAERAYLDFLGAEWGMQPHCLKPLTLGPALLDPNGGSACGIGARVLEHFGVRAIEVNAELGYPEHAIDTDGIDPASGRHMLLRVSRAIQRYGARFGIAFDYDADRGNLVLPGSEDCAIIKPQTVATLNIALALSHREISKVKSDRPLAIVVSDATSGSCDKVAAYFGARVFTVETGEINVVTKMYQLRQEGYDVPIGVEGANGGSIFDSATCRDGLQTALCSALADEQPALARQWMRVLRRNGQHSPVKKALRLPEILSEIPCHYNRMLRFEGSAMEHSEVKDRIEHTFKTSIWPTLSDVYKSYRFADYEGTATVEARTGDQTGGWRLILDDGKDRAFVFVRGSRTEAGVWRIIADDPYEARFNRLLEGSISMMEQATSGQIKLVRR